MKTFFKIVVNTISIFLTSYLVNGISLDGPLSALFVAVIIAALNAFLRPLLIILTIPLTVMTMGIFILFINAFLVWIAGEFVPGFMVDSFWTAFWFSILSAVITFILEIPERIRSKQIQFRRYMENPNDPEFRDMPENDGFEDAEIVDDDDVVDDEHFEEL